MWRDKVNERIKEKNISIRLMSEAVLLSEQTTRRILSGKSSAPSVYDVLNIGGYVGLSPLELFAETNSVIGDKTHLQFQEELDQANAQITALRTQIEMLSEEMTALKVENVTHKSEIEILRLKLEMKDEMISLYRSVIDKNSK